MMKHEQTLHGYPACVPCEAAHVFFGRLLTLSIRWAQRVECCPFLPKYVQVLTLEPMNVILFGERSNPKSNDTCPFKREADRDSQRRTHRKTEITVMRPQTKESHQQLREGHRMILPRASRTNPVDTLTSDSRSLKCQSTRWLFQASDLWPLVTATLGS